MCFSETASFAASGITALAAAASLSRVRSLRQAPLAGIPAFFALQQGAEGVLWRALQGGETATIGWLTPVYLGFALVFWPLFGPLATLAAEKEPWRRNALMVVFALGVGVAGYDGYTLFHHPFTAVIISHGICYAGSGAYPWSVLAFYAFATCGAFLIAGERLLQIVGAVLLLGFIVSSIFYFYSFLSVWCFFAAIASVMIAFYFAPAHASWRELGRLGIDRRSS